MRISRRVVMTLLILVNLGGLGWWQRKPILAWWQVHELMHASEANRDVCVDRVVALREAALPRLLAALTSSDQATCENLEAGLTALAQQWKSPDPRAATLLEQLRAGYAVFSSHGQAAALHAAVAALSQDNEAEHLPVGIAQAAGDLLQTAAAGAAPRAPLLRLASALVARVARGQWLQPCRALARSGLTETDPQTRVAALQLAVREPLRDEADVLNQALALLRDPEADVRQAALLALAPLPDVLTEDDLLPLLHDADIEVQQLCELALRGRGLQDEHLKLARLISDESPAARLQVIQHLRGGGDVEPNVWLKRLSQDVSPAVRAAAVRAAAARPQADLRQRLTEMMQRDASPTVRELAAHYLARTKKN